MRITFALPFVNLTGGIRLLLQYANWLHDRGDQVTVVVPIWPYRFHFTRQQQLGELHRTIRQAARVPWCDLRCALKRVPVIHPAFMPPADVVVATSWPVVRDVAGLPHTRGRKVHVLFHHETGTGSEEQIVATYALPFYRVAASHTVRRELERQSAAIDAVVPAGIDGRLFYPEGIRAPNLAMMLFHNDPRKGAVDGFAALARVREQLPDLRVRICGTVQPRDLAPWSEFELCPNDDELRRRYSEATVFLYPSLQEGFGLPPLEAMACGCPVVTTNVGAVSEFTTRTNAQVVEPGDIEGLSRAMIRVLTDAELRASMSLEGKVTAAAYSVSASAQRFRDALCASLATA